MYQSIIPINCLYDSIIIFSLPTHLWESTKMQMSVTETHTQIQTQSNTVIMHISPNQSHRLAYLHMREQLTKLEETDLITIHKLGLTETQCIRVLIKHLLFISQTQEQEQIEETGAKWKRKKSAPSSRAYPVLRLCMCPRGTINFYFPSARAAHAP